MIVPAGPDAVARAAELIRAGEVIAFPTETVYGLGADATNAVAVARVFEIKARPSFDPLIVHVAGVDHLSSIVAQTPPAVRELARHFWPGPLTIVVPKTEHIPDIVTAGLQSVAVRVPDHPVALDLIRKSDRPIAAPSANRFGCISPTTAAHVLEQLGEQPSMILDGGACRVGVESTVLSLLESQPELLRPGGVTLEELEAILGPIRLRTSGKERLAPGRLARHYAPRTPLILVESTRDIARGDRRHTALLLVQPAPEVLGFAHTEILAEVGDLHRAAANLFAALRRLDDGSYDRIYAVAIPERGLGHAIMDRLRRAATPECP